MLSLLLYLAIKEDGYIAKFTSMDHKVSLIKNSSL